MKEIRNRSFDEERALYASEDVLCEDCTFAGPADGESAFKESRELSVKHCRFELRYPFWHDREVKVRDSFFSETCRAAFWYTENAALSDCRMRGVKAFRECKDISFENCDIVSQEFGWNCRGVRFSGGSLSSEYFLFGASDVSCDGLNFSGKYSFQYVRNAELRHCVLKTKDAFWHSENVTVYDSVIEGEYLGWYAKNLRLVRCHIKGTQPLCSAENLVLEDCTTEDCDLSFEYSTVRADIRGTVLSVKNPAEGSITADGYGEIIFDEHRRCTDCQVMVRASKSETEAEH